ncbi:MAG: deoxyribonuclease IV [Candidatus Pacebacteria bacterium]|jgi:deoxyribonuclease IV|nr:deoxyribonuclease IV [Candidatus Paceibacterota bacterium]MBT4652697.1 deoxyribonuclease IV [Candidatus Paceibacterota bacterium]MBT6755854.1 deoxyribonuclease IV [Candidatus Paceibacterota bacterium]MBT6921067.1 deoxyribonuclease IV [Candidatus Paceibacterota bacterium]
MKSAKTKRIGAHLSTTGGVDKAVERAHAIGANALQIFSGSPRMWRRTSLDRINVDKISANRDKYDVTPIFTHALYLVNLATDKPELAQKSIEALEHDLRFDSHIKGAGVVVHLGSHQGRGFDATKDLMVQRISEVLEDTPEDSTFIIENSAGQKGKIASDLTEIRWLMDQLKSDRVSWCFDTCHGFAAGWNLSGENSVVDTIEKLDLLDTLACVHVNDSRDTFASGRDRHANLGEGNIPPEELEEFVNDKRLKNIPLVLEVPGEGKGPDAENINKLKKMLK